MGHPRETSKEKRKALTQNPHVKDKSGDTKEFIISFINKYFLTTCYELSTTLSLEDPNMSKTGQNPYFLSVFL